MAIYDFQGPSNLSALLGQGVGQGLGAGLEDIFKNKMGQYQQQQELAHQQKQMAQLGEQYKALGLNPAMAYAPPQVQQEMMKQQQRSQLATLLSGGQQMPQEQQGLQQLMPQQAAQQPVQNSSQLKLRRILKLNGKELHHLLLIRRNFSNVKKRVLIGQNRLNRRYPWPNRSWA